MGDIGVNGFQVVCFVYCGDIVGCQLGQFFFSVVVGFFCYYVSGFVFMIWCFQVEYVDYCVEQQEVDEEEYYVYYQQYLDVFVGGWQVVYQYVVNCICGEGEVCMDFECCCDEQVDIGQYCMQEVQQWSQEYEQEFQWFGYFGQECGDGYGQQYIVYYWMMCFWCCQIYCQCCIWQIKYYDWEEVGYEYFCGVVVGVEVVDVVVEYSVSGVSEFINLESGDSVQYLMQIGWDQQMVDEIKDIGIQCFCGDDLFVVRVDSVLYWWLDVVEDCCEDQIEEVGGDWYEVFVVEEVQEVWQFDVGLVVVYCFCYQIGNDIGQYVYIDFWVDGDYCFGYYEIFYCIGQCCRIGVIFGLV